MEAKEKESLFSAKNRKLIFNPLNVDNPITVQVLGICSALAVTAKLKPAFVMALSVVIVTAFSNLVISVIRNGIPPRIRIIVQLTVVATLVILVDQLLKAFVYDVSKQLSVFVGLIITNCILMGRLEAFAMANKPWQSFLDGIGNGLGYSWILLVLGFVRELFGSGTLWGYKVMPQALYELGYKNNGLIILPPMALILVGLIIWIQRSRTPELIDKS
jgi:Na+-transporting NADH:ubiquinone oxidoreductase subunit D